QRAKTFVLSDHRRPSSSEAMAEHRLRDAENGPCFLRRESEHFLQHQRRLLLRGQCARIAGETERDVLADFISKVRLRHQLPECDNPLRVRMSLAFAD